MNFFKRVGQGLLSYDDGNLPAEASRNLRIMILAVLIGTVGTNINAGSAFTGYIKALGATDFMLGILMAMPFCVRFFQIFASYVLERTRKRKLLMCSFGIFARLLWLPIGLVPLFVPAAQQSLRVWVVLMLYTLFAASSTMIDTCFFSVAADVVPMRIRGRFFSVRSKLSMVVAILTGLGVSYLLDNVSGADGLLGYIIAFSVCAIFGAADIACFLFMRFPAMENPVQDEARTSLPRMIGDVLRSGSFMKLVLFWTFWSFAVNIMAPYFNVYMLGHLRMSFMEITLVCSIPANLCSFLFVQKWGRVMDQHGYKAILYFCMTIGALLPFLWLFCGPRNFFWPVLIAQSLSGSIWPAIDLSSQNTLMNASPSRNRSMFIAMFMVITQLCGVALGFVTGGFLLDNVFSPLALNLAQAGYTFFGLPITQYHFLLLCTALLRLATPYLFLRGVDLEPGVSTLGVMREVAGGSWRSFRLKASMARAQILRRRARRKEDAES